MTINQRLLNRRLDDFEWSVRTLTCLTNQGLVTVRDLCRTTQAQLQRLPNFGAKSLIEVKEWLVDRQLRLGMDLGPSRAGKVPNRRGTTPLCVARVKLSSVVTLTRLNRERKAERRGIPPEQCGEYATWMLDGDPLCLPHAGRRALAILAGEE